MPAPRSTKPLPEIVDIYAIPDVYDVLHSPGTSREVAGAIRSAKRYAGGDASPPKCWIEPGCGTGRYVRALASKGCTCLGVDISSGMIEYARSRTKETKGGSFLVGDMCHLDKVVGKQRFDAAINLINSIRHLENDRQLDSHLDSVCNVLKPGGVYVCGISLAMYGFEQPTEDVWNATRGRMKVTQVIQYDPPTASRGPAARMERAYSHITVTSPSYTREYVSSYSLRCYSKKQWLEAIERSGLRLAAVVNEAGKEIDIPELGYGIFVLRRPLDW